MNRQLTMFAKEGVMILAIALASVAGFILVMASAIALGLLASYGLAALGDLFTSWWGDSPWTIG